jgi:hypothetical protein
VDGEANLADLALVTASLRFDLPHHARLLGDTERAGQRSTMVMRQPAGGCDAGDYE